MKLKKVTTLTGSHLRNNYIEHIPEALSGIIPPEITSQTQFDVLCPRPTNVQKDEFNKHILEPYFLF